MAHQVDTTTSSHAKSIAVFDVGKTNKKLLVFNGRLDLVDAAYHTFDQYEKDGVQIEAIEETSAWLIASLREMATKHDIGAVSVSTHGAAFACIDGAGKLALPVLSYTTDPGQDFYSRFSAEFGDPVTLQRETKTPDMIGLGCMAKGIRFAQERWPEAFRNVTAILPLPQYYGFVLTGKTAIDPTNVGCHTAFWNFEEGDWSPLLDRMGLRGLFPRSISNPWDVLGPVTPDVARATGLAEDTVVTVGIHDSNASLLPYLIKETPPFVVNSTGTVSVSLRPTPDVTLRDEDLGKIVYYNLSAFKTPVKTTIFMGGMEFDTYMGLLSSIHGSCPHPPLDRGLLEAYPHPAALRAPLLYPLRDVPRLGRPGRGGGYGHTAGRALHRHLPGVLQGLPHGLSRPGAFGRAPGRGGTFCRGTWRRDAALYRGGICPKRDLYESAFGPLPEGDHGHHEPLGGHGVWRGAAGQGGAHGHRPAGARGPL